MSADKDKADPPAAVHPGAKPATTVVGVPSLPQDRPSDLALTREIPPQSDDPTLEPPTRHAKAMSDREADHVLAGAAPRPRSFAPSRPEPLSKLVAGKTPAPKPVPMRPREPSIEEISASMILSEPALPADADDAVELSESVLIEEPPDGRGPPVVKPVHAPNVPPPAPSSGKSPGSKAPPPMPASVHTPAPAPAAVAKRTLLGMPDLPKATPGPSLDPVAVAGPLPRDPVAVAGPLPRDFAPVPAEPPPEAVVSPPAVEPLDEPPPPPIPQPEPLPLDASGLPIPEPVPLPEAIAKVSFPPPPSQAPQTNPMPLGGPSAGETGGTAPMTGDIELTRLPSSGIGRALEAIQLRTRKLLDAAGPFARRLHAAVGAVARMSRRGAGADGNVLRRIAATLRGWTDKMLEALPEQAARRRGSRPIWFLPAVGVAGLLVGIGLVGALVALVRACTSSSRSASDARAVPSAHASAARPSTASSLAAARAAPPAPVLPPCAVVGPPHVIGPSATIAAGVEVVPTGDDVALGYASDDHEGMAVRVDPASLTASSTAHAKSHELVRHVMPLLTAKGALSLVVDADKKSDPLQGRRTLRASPLVQLGASGGHLAWASVGGAPAGPLWPVDDGAPVDALRGAVETTGDRQTIALAFRHGSAVWMGAASRGGSPALETDGDLAQIEGLGTVVGSPAVALSGGVAMVAWADRASSDDPWRLRWVRFEPGQAPKAPNDFVPPAGGKGEQAMSPGLAALPGGRFLFVWTEGPASGHDVRALTLGPDGRPIGAPLVISTPGINAGEGRAGVNDAGQGVVAFLEASASGFEVVATPLSCGKP